MFKALILSLIDYWCQAYESATTATKQKLCIVQSKALKTCCGSMKFTSCSAVEVECGVIPLSLRRENLYLKYALKLTAQHGLDNPTKAILVETWHQYYIHNHNVVRAFSTGVNPILLKLNLNIKQIYIDPASWKLVPCRVDLTLQSKINKQTDSYEI